MTSANHVQMVSRLADLFLRAFTCCCEDSCACCDAAGEHANSTVFTINGDIEGDIVASYGAISHDVTQNDVYAAPVSGLSEKILEAFDREVASSGCPWFVNTAVRAAACDDIDDLVYRLRRSVPVMSLKISLPACRVELFIRKLPDAQCKE